MRNRSQRATPLAVAIMLALSATTQAQDSKDTSATKDLDRIVVTGSNIPRTDSETASPVQVITAVEIERTGKQTVGEYLQTLTANGQGSIPKSFGSGFASGGAGVSLRGLGAGSTLVLLNGRRLAPHGLADDGQKVFTDLSTIPTEAVQTIEVLKDGASAIYGSDAIAGVVNIILKANYQGFAARASYGISGDNDMANRKVSAIAGFGDLADGANVFFTMEVGNNDGTLVSSRKNRKWIGTSDLRPWGYSVEGSPTLGGSIQGGGTVGTSSPAVNLRRSDGTYFSLPGCSQFSDIAPADPGGGCLWDVAPWRSLVPDEKYLTLFGRATARISDNAEFYAEVGFSEKKTRWQVQPSGVSGSWGYPGGPVNASSGPGATLLGANHPDNPLGYAARPRYAAFDVGPRVTNNKNQFERLLFGVNGIWGEWNYDVGYLHSATQLSSRRTGYLRYSHVREVLLSDNNPLHAYWRLGDDAHRNSQAMYDYISPEITAQAATSLDMLDFKANRTLWELPGGPLALALGAEYRSQKVELTPQTFTDIGDIIGLGYSAYKGSEKVGVAFAEVLAPISNSFEISAALRADSYQGGDTAVTPKLGMKWTPVSWLALRGTYGEGFRAPNAAESGDGGLAAFTTAADPIRCPGGTPAPNGGTQADCAAPLAVITSPNPDLVPEKSKSYTLGFVLNPTHSTSLTVDAWQIKRTDEINQESTAAAILAGNVVRNDNNLPGIPNSGTLLAARARYVNSASSIMRGIDFDVRHEMDLGDAGTLAFDMQWSRINLFRRDDGAGSVFQYAGTHGNCDVTNCAGTPKNRANAGITWGHDTWSVSAVANYIGSFKNIQFQDDPAGCAALFADNSNAPAGCRIPSFTTVDLSGKWKVLPRLELSASLQNAFDTIAPLDPLTYGAVNYNPMHYSGAVGRYFTVGVRYEFK